MSAASTPETPQAAPVAATSLPRELRQREVLRMMGVFFQLRSLLIVPAVAGLLGFLVWLDPAGWKVVGLCLLAVLLAVIAVLDQVRLRRDRLRVKSIAADLTLAAVMQTGLIFFTGAIESPLVIVYIGLTFITGIALGAQRSRWLVVGTMSLLLWAMVLVRFFGAPSTTPSFLQIGEGFGHRPIYAVTTAGVLQIMMIVMTVLAGRLGFTIDRVIGDAINARQGQLDALKAHNRELVTLSSTIAHELKNPLASVYGLVQLLERSSRTDKNGNGAKGGAADDNSAERWQVLRQEITRIRTTLDEFLNFSRPLGELTSGTVSLGAMIQELTLLYEEMAAGREITLEPPSESAEVVGDPRKIKQALINLLQNAVDASEPGSRIQWVVERRTDDPARPLVAVGVRDHGPGIPDDVIDRAAEVGVSTKPDGSGIGLAIVRSIAEQHGGTLAIANRDEGCEAVIVLPLRTDARAA